MSEYCVTKDVKEVEAAIENGQKVAAANNLGSYRKIGMGLHCLEWYNSETLGTKHGREFRIYPKPAKEYSFFEALELAGKNRGIMFARADCMGPAYKFMFQGACDSLMDATGCKYNVDIQDLTAKFIEVTKEDK